jgi:hypothetical protein
MTMAIDRERLAQVKASQQELRRARRGVRLDDIVSRLGDARTVGELRAEQAPLARIAKARDGQARARARSHGRAGQPIFGTWDGAKLPIYGRLLQLSDLIRVTRGLPAESPLESTPYPAGWQTPLTMPRGMQPPEGSTLKEILDKILDEIRALP